MTRKSPNSPPPTVRSLVGFLMTNGQTSAVLSREHGCSAWFHSAIRSTEKHYCLMTLSGGKVLLTPLDWSLRRLSWWEVVRFCASSIDLAQQGTIDFDDQIYMSTLFAGLYSRYHTVICDEGQDISHLNRLQLLQELLAAGS